MYMKFIMKLGGKESILEMVVIIRFENVYHSVHFRECWIWVYTKQWFCQLLCMGVKC